MTHNKNNIPVYEEQQFIQQKIKIPSNFVELKTVGKNYICSTQGWPKEPVCERYGFSANGKWFQLDIPHQLMKKLELELGKEIAHPIYISQKILEQKADEFGGITINNEKDILLQTDEIILTQEKETQVDFTSGQITDLKQKLERSEQLSQETQKLLEIVSKDNEEKHIAIIFFEQQIKDLTNRITELRNNLEKEILAKKREVSKNKELERIIKKLKEDEQILIGLQNQISDLQKQLGNERLACKEAKQDLQNKIQERDERLTRYGNKTLKHQWEINLLKKEIDQLNDIVRLLKELSERELSENQDAINDLNTQINQLTIERNKQDQTITNLSDDKNRLNGEINDLRTRLTQAQNSSSNYYNQVQDLNRQISSLNPQLSSANSDVDYYRNQYYSYYSKVNSLENDVNRLRKEKDDLSNRGWWTRLAYNASVSVVTDTGWGVEDRLKWSENDSEVKTRVVGRNMSEVWLEVSTKRYKVIESEDYRDYGNYVSKDK